MKSGDTAYLKYDAQQGFITSVVIVDINSDGTCTVLVTEANDIERILCPNLISLEEAKNIAKNYLQNELEYLNKLLKNVNNYKV